MDSGLRIAVVGLGYVGLPLAVTLARHYAVTGLDVNRARVDELRAAHDRTGEVTEADLAASTLAVTAEPKDTAGFDVYIVTVPTPVDTRNRPDLGALRAACATVGGVL